MKNYMKKSAELSHVFFTFSFSFFLFLCFFRYNQRKRGGAAMFIKSRILTVLDCMPVALADVEIERELMELVAEKHRKEP